MNLNYQLILASKSPRRKALLEQLSLPFKVVDLKVEETYPSDLPVTEVAEYLANLKSSAYSLKEGELLITADTVVIINNEILGKPADEKMAIQMLQRLSGTIHQVVSGVCLKTTKKTYSFSETTEVTFSTLSKDEIEHYVQEYRPFDKAGAYGIQEWIGMIGIEQIKGDYYNVVGLPLHGLWKGLSSFQ